MVDEEAVHRFIPLLEGMRELLLKHGFGSSAEALTGHISSARSRSPDFFRRLRYGGLWGGQGGIGDVVFSGNVGGDREELQHDNLEYQRLKIAIAEEMRRLGLDDQHIRRQVAALRRRPEGGRQDERQRRKTQKWTHLRRVA